METFRQDKSEYINHIILMLVLQFLIFVPFVWGESPGRTLEDNARSFTFNQNRSSVRFSVSSTLHRVRGEAKKFNGEVYLSSLMDPSTGRVTLEIEATDLDTENEAINKKMRGHCLQVGRFPLIRFLSLEIHNGPKSYSLGRTARADIVGLLDLHGIKRKVSIPVDFTYTEETFYVHGKVTIKMSDFQIPDPNFLFLRVKDEVEISFDIHGIALSSSA